MLKEFKDFIAKGNVVDLAVAVIIGGAFGLIVKSLVSDVIMPIVGAIFGGISFENMFLPLDGGSYATLAAAQEAGAATLNYGLFINAVVNFLIVGFVIFLVVRQINKMTPKEEPAPPAPVGPTQEELLAEIRDLLKK
ncbi:MAG: large conductance mechanosensitive channel [Cellvibrionaceae bacterium]|jgi:large conductance mechanosensitive channel